MQLFMLSSFKKDCYDWLYRGFHSLCISRCLLPLMARSAEFLSVTSSVGDPLCAAETPQQTQTQGKHITGPLQTQQKACPPAGPPPPTVRTHRHTYTAALHNRVTEEIKRTVLLQGCAWLSSLTHFLSSNNGAFAVLWGDWVTARWPESYVNLRRE